MQKDLTPAASHLDPDCEEVVSTVSETTQHSLPLLTISFSAGGWFQMYHYGVAQALRETGVLENYQVRLCGSSAGSLAVCALAADLDFEEMKRFALECGEDCREKPWNIFKMKKYLLQSIRRFGAGPMRKENLPKVLANCRKFNLEVYATELPWLRPVVFSEFLELADVEEALSASCCFTPVVGFPFQMRRTGQWVMDGGLSAFQPRLSEPNTIAVSPFYFADADIKPSKAVPAWWGLRPPKAEQHAELFDLGYNDAVSFLVKEHLIPVTHLEKLKPLYDPLPKLGVVGLVRDAITTVLCLFVLRPIAVFLIYLELIFLAAEAFFATVLHDAAAWSELKDNIRNIISLRNLFKLLFFSRMAINELRLCRYSRLYPLLCPLLYGTWIGCGHNGTDGICKRGWREGRKRHHFRRPAATTSSHKGGHSHQKHSTGSYCNASDDSSFRASHRTHSGEACDVKSSLHGERHKCDLNRETEHPSSPGGEVEAKPRSQSSHGNSAACPPLNPSLQSAQAESKALPSPMPFVGRASFVDWIASGLQLFSSNSIRSKTPEEVRRRE